MELEDIFQETGSKVGLKIAISSIPPERQYNAPEVPLIFTHIPRTAGITVERIFRTIASVKSVMFSRAVGTIYGQYLGPDKADALDFLLKHKKKLPTLKYVFGHIPFDVHQLLGFQEANYAVVLRNPKHRALSQFRQSFKGITEISSEKVSNLIRDRKVIDNCQVRMISGCADPQE